MKIACICPTYGKPTLLQNALAMFQAQTYPVEQRRLFILEDAGQIAGDGWHWNESQQKWEVLPSQSGGDFDVWTRFSKFPTLTAKYEFLVDRALAWGADAFCVWDDDDIYLPEHLERHSKVLAWYGWSHPWSRGVYSLYTGKPLIEDATGRFHGALAFRKDYGQRIGFWGDPANSRCDYDQKLLSGLAKLSPPGNQAGKPTYVYRWGTTAADHCSGRCKSPDDVTWYTHTPISQPGHFNVLEPLMDEETRRMYEILA